MKANYKKKIYTESELKEQIERLVQERYDDITLEISAKFLGVILFMLDKEYGFKKKRLEDFVSRLQGFAMLFAKGDCLGKKADPNDCIGYIRNVYGIDLEEEVKKM